MFFDYACMSTNVVSRYHSLCEKGMVWEAQAAKRNLNRSLYPESVYCGGCSQVRKNQKNLARRMHTALYGDNVSQQDEIKSLCG